MYEGTYSVLSTPLPVCQSPAGRSLHVLNTGSAVVYLSDMPGARGFPLNPGDSKVWEDGDALWLSCLSGETSTVVVSLNTGALFSPYSIAQAITGGEELTAQSIAVALNALGVPSFNRSYYALDEVLTTIPANDVYLSPVLDLTGYSSFMMRVIGTTAGAPATTAYTVNLAWSSDAAGTQDVTYTTIQIGEGRTQVVIDRILNRYCQINIAAPVSGVDATLTLKVIASAISATPISYIEDDFPGGSVKVNESGMFIASATLAAGSTTTFTPHHYPGLASIELYTLTTLPTGNLNLFVNDSISGFGFYTKVTATPVAGTAIEKLLNLSSRPITVQVQNTSGVTISYKLAVISSQSGPQRLFS